MTRAGTFVSGGRSLAAQVFSPKAARGTVIVCHGYYDHAGVWKHAIRHLVRDGYTVAVYDQPGHGLSPGTRASIGDFGEYTAALGDFVAICTNNLPPPYHLVAHSMGCAAAIDYLQRTPESPLARVVLTAPLVRSVAWNLSGFGRTVSRSFLDSVPRKFRRNSSDRTFLAFHARDPLQTRTVPMQWVSAHRAWVERLLETAPCRTPVKIIQGTADTTVSWRYNLRLLKKKFPAADITEIKKAKHQLINESPELRATVLTLISKALT